MKILLIPILLLSVADISAQNSISNTKWKGHIENPQPLDVIFEFKTDSMIATSAEGTELEVMFFSQSGDTLKLRKINGQSPCDNLTEGFYHLLFTENGNKLTLQGIIDECQARANSITSGIGYFRMKD